MQSADWPWARPQEGFSDAWKYQELSNVAWAVASMNRRRVRLLTNLAEEVLRRQPALFAPQAISNISWSLATLNFAAYAGEQHLRELRHNCYMVEPLPLCMAECVITGSEAQRQGLP